MSCVRDRPSKTKTEKWKLVLKNSMFILTCKIYFNRVSRVETSLGSGINRYRYFQEANL